MSGDFNIKPDKLEKAMKNKSIQDIIFGKPKNIKPKYQLTEAINKALRDKK